MLPIRLFAENEQNTTTLATAQALIDASPFRGLVVLYAEHAFIEMDEDIESPEFQTPYALACWEPNTRGIAFWRRRRAYRDAYCRLAEALDAMRVYL